MTYSSIRIANYFIKKSDYEANPMKIINLVYIAHSWCLAIAGTPLIDTPIEAWQYGVAIRDLYNSLKRYGNDPITELVQYLYEEDKISENYSKLLNTVWKKYGEHTSVELCNLTHEKGTPWDKTWNQDTSIPSKSYKIKNELIMEFYKNLII